MNQVFRLDPYANVSDRQRALSLYVFTTLALALVGIALLVQATTYLSPNTPDEPPFFIFGVVSAFLALGYTLWLTQQGRLRVATWLFVLSGFWLASMTHSTVSIGFISIMWITLAVAGLICRTEDIRWIAGLAVGLFLLNLLKVSVIYEKDLP